MNLKTSFFDRRAKTHISHDDFQAAENLAEELLLNIPSMTSRPIVFVCIGTDRSTGDSLGPLVGSIVEEKNLPSFTMYGTLDDPIHAVNLSERLKEINNPSMTTHISLALMPVWDELKMLASFK